MHQASWCRTLSKSRGSVCMEGELSLHTDMRRLFACAQLRTIISSSASLHAISRLSYRPYRDGWYSAVHRLVICDNRINSHLHSLSMPLASFIWRLWLRSTFHPASSVIFERFALPCTNRSSFHRFMIDMWRAASPRWRPCSHAAAMEPTVGRNPGTLPKSILV